MSTVRTRFDTKGKTHPAGEGVFVVRLTDLARFPHRPSRPSSNYKLQPFTLQHERDLASLASLPFTLAYRARRPLYPLNLRVTQGTLKLHVGGYVWETRVGGSASARIGFWGATPVVQPSGADQVAVTLGNADVEIGGLTISDPLTQAEVQALRDACEELADAVGKQTQASAFAIALSGLVVENGEGSSVVGHAVEAEIVPCIIGEQWIHEVT
jgi:hypothetical protein